MAILFLNLFINHSSISESHPCYPAAHYPIMRMFGLLGYHCQYENIFLVIIPFSTHYSQTLYNYSPTERFDGLELQNVFEIPKAQIQHLCKNKSYARVSEQRKAMCSIF